MDGVAAGRLGMGGAGDACAGEWTGVVTGGGVATVLGVGVLDRGDEVGAVAEPLVVAGVEAAPCTACNVGVLLVWRGARAAGGGRGTPCTTISSSWSGAGEAAAAGAVRWNGNVCSSNTKCFDV